MPKNINELKRLARHERIRKGIDGTSDRLRLCIHRSLKNMSASLINDEDHKVIFGLTTQSKDFKKQLSNGGNIKAAEALGTTFAQQALAKGYKKVVFDRAGYLYHGRVKAFAEAARKAGLDF